MTRRTTMSKLPKYFYFRVRAIRHGTAIEVEDASDCDVVEVVRCEDCEYYNSVTAHCEIRGKGLYLIRGKEDYCSRAKRRNDD